MSKKLLNTGSIISGMVVLAIFAVSGVPLYMAALNGLILTVALLITVDIKKSTI